MVVLAGLAGLVEVLGGLLVLVLLEDLEEDFCFFAASALALAAAATWAAFALAATAASWAFALAAAAS